MCVFVLRARAFLFLVCRINYEICFVLSREHVECAYVVVALDMSQMCCKLLLLLLCCVALQHIYSLLLLCVQRLQDEQQQQNKQPE